MVSHVKKAFALLMAVSILFLAACAPGSSNAGTSTVSSSSAAANGGTPSQQSSSTTSTEPVTLQFVHLMNSPYYESMLRLTDKYTELNPHITFEHEVLKGDARYTVLKSRIASGTTPDLFMSVESGPSMSQWADAAVDLSDEPWWDNIDPVAIPMVTYNEKRIALPFNSNVWGILYNKDVFEAAGITTFPKTLSELQAVCDKIKAAGKIPFGAGFKDVWVGAQLFQHTFGNDLGSYDDVKKRFEEYSAGTAKVSDDTWLGKSLDLMELVKNNCQPNPFNSDSTMQFQMLATGEAGMVIQGDWAEPPARLIDPECNIGIMLMPMSEDPADAKIYTQFAARTVFVGKGTGHEQQSKDFVNWIVTDSWVHEWYNTDFMCIAPIKGVNPQGPTIQVLEDGAKLFADSAQVAPWGKSLAPPELFAQFPSIQDEFILGQITKEEVIATVSAEWEKYAQSK